MKLNLLLAVPIVGSVLSISWDASAFECPKHFAQAQEAIDKTSEQLKGMKKIMPEMMSEKEMAKIHSLLANSRILLSGARQSHKRNLGPYDHAYAIAKAESAFGYALATRVIHQNFYRKVAQRKSQTDSSSGVQYASAEAKPLKVVMDPSRETVLIGRTAVGGMLIQLELEPAKGMWMRMGTPPKWMGMKVEKGEFYHVEVKPIDPKSKTRISYAEVMFMAINRDNGRKVEGMLHPMWGGSGLHYAMNSGLAGDGNYQATVTVKAPTFARDMKNKQLWMAPTTAEFVFQLDNGKLTKVSKLNGE